MKTTIKFLLIFCIVASIGYDSMTQDNPSKDIPDGRIILQFGTNGGERERVSSITPANLDYTQLQYTICLNRSNGKYKLGEPIFICSRVKNKSDSILLISVHPPRYLFSADRVSLVDADGHGVPMTRTGRQENEWVKNGKDGVKESVFIGSRVWNLKSQEEWVFASGPIVLNQYFDLTQPGVYHLTFHRIGFLVVQNDRKSLASNTLTFEVLDKIVTPDDLRDPGEFNWPPSDTVKPDAE